jgi:hypothetical protein
MFSLISDDIQNFKKDVGLRNDLLEHNKKSLVFVTLTWNGRWTENPPWKEGEVFSLIAIYHRQESNCGDSQVFSLEPTATAATAATAATSATAATAANTTC